MIAERFTDPAEFFVVQAALEAGRSVTVQFSSSRHSTDSLREVNRLAKLFNSALEVRFYGHYGEVFNFNVLSNLRDVSNFSADCLDVARNFEQLAEMPVLKRLRLGIHHNTPPDLLAYKNLRNLEVLKLGPTKSSNLDLKYLEQYLNLSDLGLCGHTKEIESVAESKNLKTLTLISMGNKQSLSFVNTLPILRRLTVLFGGRESIAEVSHPSLHALEIIRVKGLQVIDPDRFPALRCLSVEDQIKLTHIQFSNQTPLLEYVKIWNCKSLISITGIPTLTKLLSLGIAHTAVSFDSVHAQVKEGQLGDFVFHSQSRKENKTIQETLKRQGYGEHLLKHAFFAV